MKSTAERMVMANNILLPEVRRLVAAGHEVEFRVKGISMRPFIEGDADSVKLVKCDVPHDYDIILAEVASGVFVLHRIVKIEGSNITLMGDGNIRGMEHCQISDICGRAIAIHKPDGRWVRVDEWWFVCCSKWWRRLLPVRRYLLAVWKRVFVRHRK